MFIRSIPKSNFVSINFFKFILFILRERESEKMSEGETEGEGERESQAGSAFKHDWGLELTTMRS